jgi:hypothetical protein
MTQSSSRALEATFPRTDGRPIRGSAGTTRDATPTLLVTNRGIEDAFDAEDVE